MSKTRLLGSATPLTVKKLFETMGAQNCTIVSAQKSMKLQPTITLFCITCPRIECQPIAHNQRNQSLRALPERQQRKMAEAVGCQGFAVSCLFM
jgi:hypothetical protein